MRLFLVLLLAAHLNAAVPMPPEGDEWQSLQAGEFTIYSNASERETREIATNLLRMREAVGKVTRLNVRAPKPIYVFVFRTKRSFAPYRDAIFGQRDAKVSGGFLPSRLANFIVVDAEAEGGVNRVVHHELAHSFIRNTIPGLPLWLDEGLAEYYSTFTVRGDQVTIGWPIPDHVLALRRGPLVPIEQHFAVDHDSPAYNEEARAGIFYAESWALVHYFLSGDDARRARLNQFMAAIRAGKSPAGATPLLGARSDEIEHAVRTYVQRPSMQFLRYTVRELAIPDLGELRPVPRDELLYALGALMAWNRRTQADGEMLLTEALRLNPKNAAAHAMLGYVLDARDDRANAASHYERAIALGSNDAEIHLSYGMTLIESDGDKRRARQLFQRAAQLDPNDARAWAGIGMTYVSETSGIDAGIAALEKSLALAPAQEDAAVNLIQLLAESGRLDDAQRVFARHLAHSTNDEYLRIARDALEFAAVRAAEHLFDEGKEAQAIDAMRGILARTQDEALREHLTGVIGSYDEHVERERQSKAIANVMAKANAGKTKEALALLDALIPSVSDEDWRKQLIAMRKELARR